MHAIWGLGLLSLTKAVVVVDEWVERARLRGGLLPRRRQRRPEARRAASAEGPLDHLDHAPTLQFYGGKLGIDATHEGPRGGHAAVAAGDRDERRGAPLVDERWDEYGLGGVPRAPNGRRESARCANCYVVDAARPATIESRRPTTEGETLGRAPGGRADRSFRRPASGRSGFAVGIVCLLVGLVDQLAGRGRRRRDRALSSGSSGPATSRPARASRPRRR